MRVGGRNLFPKTKSEGKGSKKKAYIQIKNRKDLHMCIFCCKFAADLICASMRSRSAISLMGPIGLIGLIGLIGRREDAELQDGRRPEGKESGFRSLESI